MTAALTCIAVAGLVNPAAAATGRYVFHYTPAGSVAESPNLDMSCMDPFVPSVPMVCLDGSERSGTVSVTDALGRPAIGIYSMDPDTYSGSSPAWVVCGTATFSIPTGMRNVNVEVGGDPQWCGQSGTGVAALDHQTPITETGATVVITLSS